MAGKPAKTLQEKVKLSQLKTLVAVATSGSFSEAALQLDVSQSTVSHSIAALEEALGVTLIHRGRQRASLTPVGHRICEQAAATLTLVDEMGKEAARARGTDGGLVRIGAFRSLASEILPGAIAHLHEHHPTIHVSIVEYDGKRELVNSLQEGEVDLVFAALLLGDDYETFLIMEDPVVALLPPSRPDIPSQLSWDDLRQHPLITSSSDCCQGLTARLRQVNPPIDVDYFIANDSTAVSMTRQGLGITLLPELATRPVPNEVRVASPPFNITRPLGISWLKDSLLTPATYAFLDTFKHLDRGYQSRTPVVRSGIVKTA